MELHPYRTPVYARTILDEAGETVHVITDAVATQVIADAFRHRKLLLEVGERYSQENTSAEEAISVDLQLDGIAPPAKGLTTFRLPGMPPQAQYLGDLRQVVDVLL